MQIHFLSTNKTEATSSLYPSKLQSQFESIEMMRTDIESLWVFALASKCANSFTTQPNIAWALAIIGLGCLSVAVLYWAYPGGPAWGSSQVGRCPNPIPGPSGLPLIGSMGLMGGLAHRRIAAQAAASNASRLMAFSMGSTRVIVTCHPDVAKDILNSSVFADRPVKESAYSLMFHRAIGFAPYGVYWRTLRRVAATHLFCPKQIKASEPQRHDIAAQMARWVHRKAAQKSGFAVREVLKRASLNNMMCSVFGRVYGLDSVCSEAEELKELVDQGYHLLGTLNWSDHIPFLSFLDPQKIRLRCSKLVPQVNRFLARIIADHRAQTRNTNLDFVDVLLSLEPNDKLTDSDMIAVLWEMIFRGTDTVAVLIEWVVARMVIHQDVQSRVQEELDRVVGVSRAVTESDVAGMPYLQAVIKEVLRVHPPGPLLSWARLAITDTTVDGHHVPAGTTAMVNMWAISRDPKLWPDPQQFVPERFVARPGEAEFSVMGSDLRLAPFGSGRRTCPGKALGLSTVTFWVASMLHHYKWLPVDDEHVIDLSELLRLSCEMANPLMVRVKPRLNSTDSQ